MKELSTIARVKLTKKRVAQWTAAEMGFAIITFPEIREAVNELFRAQSSFQDWGKQKS